MKIPIIKLSLPIGFMMLLVSVPWSSPLSAMAASPDQLQQQGIDRIQGYIDNFRQTGDQRSRLPQLQQAAQELEQSVELFEEKGNRAQAALSLVKLGDIQRMVNQHQQALGLYKEGLRVAAQVGHQEYQAKALLGMTRVEMYGLRNYGEAEDHVKTALPLTAALKQKDLHVDALDYQAQVQIYQGDLIAASATLNRALEMVGETEDETRLFYIYLDRAEIYQKLGEQCDYQRAFKACYQALDLSQKDYEEARRLARKFGWLGLAQETEGFLKRLELRRMLVKSQENFHQQIGDAGIFHPKQPSDVVVQEQFAAGSQTVPAGMLGIIQAAGATADAGDPRSLYIRGLFHEMQGNNEAALNAFLQAVEALERDRGDLRDDHHRGTFLEDKIDLYYPPILHLLDQKHYGAAFNLLERSRGRALADLLNSRALTVGNSQEHESLGKIMNLRATIASLQKDLFAKQSRPDREQFTKKISDSKAQIQRLEQEHEQLLTGMGAQAPRLQQLLSPPIPTLEDVQGNLRGSDFEIVEYLVQESQIVLWHIRGDATQVKSVFLPRTEVIKKVAALRKTLTNANENFDEATARELFLFLIQPILNDIRSQHLVIIPHDALNQLPFQVLQNPTDKMFLGERFRISYAPSASVLVGLSRVEQLTDKQLLAVADPGISVAPGEVKAIAALYPDRHYQLVDRLITEHELQSKSKDHDLIHLSVHGKFNPQEPMLSYLELKPDDTTDGRLTAAEMFGLPLQKTQLVVLSACDTGRAQTTHANETLGMVRALLYAGAQTLVLSSWEVDTDSTALWMETFYKAGQTHRLGEAARQALVAVKSNSKYRHPYYWGAFLMIGK